MLESLQNTYELIISDLAVSESQNRQVRMAKMALQLVEEGSCCKCGENLPEQLQKQGWLLLRRPD